MHMHPEKFLRDMHMRVYQVNPHKPVATKA